MKGTTRTPATFLQLFDGDHQKVDELDKASAFAQIEAKEIQQSRLQQENLQEQVNAARLIHVRAETLYSKGHAPAARVETTHKKLIELEKELESQKLELLTRIKVAEKNIGKRYISGDNVIGADLVVTALRGAHQAIPAMLNYLEELQAERAFAMAAG